MPELKNVTLFHFTAFRNLESILSCDCLKSFNILLDEGIKHVNVAYSHIQERRRNTIIPETNLCLHDFVPFMFAPRSPMLYAVIGGKVAEAEEKDQENLIYLVTDTGAVADTVFWFSDYHPVLNFACFYNELRDLDKIDWFVINQDNSEGMIGGFCRYWTPNKVQNGVLAPYDRYAKRQETRQAEFLIYNELSLNKILKIGVKSETMRQRVCNLLIKYGKLNDIQVEIKPEWYF